MARPMNMSRDTRGGLALVGIVGLAIIGSGLGCNKKDKADGAPAASQPAASQPAATQPPASTPTATAPAGDGNLHCDQFLTKDELAALGLAMHPTAPEMSQDVLVSCNYDSVVAMIWRGDYYDSSVVGGFKANGSAVQPDNGPKIGAATIWVTMGSMHMVGFQPASKKYTASVGSSDKAKAEKVASALNAKFEKM